MDTVSKDSTETQEVVCQERVVLYVVLQEVCQVALQGVCRDRQDHWELRGLQGIWGLETIEVLQTGCQEDQCHWEAWVHIEGIHLGPCKVSLLILYEILISL